MNTDRADRSNRSIGQVLIGLLKGCATLLLVAILLGVAGCQVVRYRDKQRIMAAMPPAVARGTVEALDVCDRIFGGGAFIIRVPGGPLNLSQLQQPAGSKENDRDARERAEAPWQPITGQWVEGPPTGLLCLRSYDKIPGTLSEHLYRSGGYVRRYGSRGADYYIPSLGIVVGGFDPR